jgi:23S rRNA U2552 (ribose-2'-O)-methylase RlmE/FtsJ
MTQFSPIAKYDTYNERMSAGMLDKLFFVDKIDAQVIVDIGCADGTLIRYLHDWMTDTTSFIGYDNDPKMSHQAAFAFTRPEMIEKLGDTRIRSTVFWSEWKQVQSFVTEQKKQGKKSAVVMSSVIHEVHHYGQPQEIDEFWARIFGAGFDYIVIRDMIPTGYDVLYHEHSALPFIKRTVRTDFGIELKDATHLKLILERRA